MDLQFVQRAEIHRMETLPYGTFSQRRIESHMQQMKMHSEKVNICIHPQTLVPGPLPSPPPGDTNRFLLPLRAASSVHHIDCHATHKMLIKLTIYFEL